MSTTNTDAWQMLFADPDDGDRIPWSREPMRFQVGEAMRGLITSQLISHWLRFANLRYPQFNLATNGNAVPPTTFTTTRVLGVHQLSGCADADAIATHISGGATLTLSNPHEWHPPLAAFCHQLSQTTSAGVGTFAYLTPPNSRGSRPHRDNAEVLVVQLEGSKQWDLYDVPADDTWQMGMIPGDPQPSETLQLAEGEGLFVPAGMGHRAAAGPRGSLHLTISVTTPRLAQVAMDWLARWRNTVPQNARMPVAPQGRLSAAEDLLRRLAKSLSETTPENLLRPARPSNVDPGRDLPLW